MTIFIISTILFSILALAFTLTVTVWTYEDAKLKSNHTPMIWVVIVLFTSPIGIILYLIIGRHKKDVPGPTGFRLPIIIFTLLFLASAAFFTYGTVRFVQEVGGASVRMGSFSGSRSHLRNETWTFTANRANGHERRNINFTAAQLNDFHVFSDSGGGTTLRLEQNNNVKTVDISGFVDRNVDLSAFEPGRVRVRLDFDRADDVYVRLSW
ncbi:MAG: PLDc N-terminal domain-containing protein [Defluviitaleaceae bacterium]|nr:PLDc N-terminal domain-containing protein [Defluviitaleaceae bacterium]